MNDRRFEDRIAELRREVADAEANASRWARESIDSESKLKVLEGALTVYLDAVDAHQRAVSDADFNRASIENKAQREARMKLINLCGWKPKT